MNEDPSLALDQAAAKFAADLHNTLSNTFPGPFEPFAVITGESRRSNRNVLITHQPRLGIELRAADGDRLFTIQLKYRCTWDGKYLTVEASDFKIGLSGVSEPLIRFDYVREPLGGTPGAHINVHAHRDEFVYAMVRAGTKDQVNASGLRVPRLAHLHLPVGGKRFRPCLEDILEFLATDFHLETKEGYREVLAAGRMDWRIRQLKAMTRRHPQVVADALRASGATVTWPERHAFECNDYGLGLY